MADFVYGISASDRKRGDFPQLDVRNMLAENVPTEPGTALQSRPGLENSGLSVDVAAPVKGLFKADGVLNNSLFAATDTNLFKDGTNIGTVNGTGPASFDGYADFIFYNAGQNVFGYDNSTLTTIDFPDGAYAVKVLVAASRAVAIRANTGSFYWTEPLGTTIDGLSFATAESRPDTLVDMVFVGDKLMLFGAETTEYWQVSPNSDLPFSPIVGTTIPVGCKNTGCATNFNRSFAWITNYNEICVGGAENIVSDPDLQVKIKESSSHRLWVFYVDDNEYLAVTLDDETWVLGARSGVWSTFSSNGEDNWVCQCYDDGYFGTTLDNGNLVQWSDGYDDFGGPVERLFAAWSPITAGVDYLSNVVLRTNPGTTPYPDGLYSDPFVELRSSLDGGKTWLPWKRTNLGAQGKYRTKVYWYSLGQFAYPGMLVNIRCTDPVPFRISGLAYNEPFGGR